MNKLIRFIPVLFGFILFLLKSQKIISDKAAINISCIGILIMLTFWNLYLRKKATIEEKDRFCKFLLVVILIGTVTLLSCNLFVF
jgi:hypothetical protein